MFKKGLHLKKIICHSRVHLAVSLGIPSQSWRNCQFVRFKLFLPDLWRSGKSFDIKPLCTKWAEKTCFLRIFTNIFENVTNLPPFLILPPAWPCKFFYLRVSLILGTSNMSHKLEIFLIVSVQKCIDLRSGNQQNVKTLVCTLYKPSVPCKRDLSFPTLPCTCFGAF